MLASAKYMADNVRTVQGLLGSSAFTLPSNTLDHRPVFGTPIDYQQTTNDIVVALDLTVAVSDPADIQSRSNRMYY